MYSFQNFGKHVEDGQKKEGLGGRNINWVIGIIWRRIIQISTIVAVHYSTWYPATGREEGLLYGGLPVIQEREEYKIIVEFPVYVAGKKVMLIRP